MQRLVIILILSALCSCQRQELNEQKDEKGHSSADAIGDETKGTSGASTVLSGAVSSAATNPKIKRAAALSGAVSSAATNPTIKRASAWSKAKIIDSRILPAAYSIYGPTQITSIPFDENNRPFSEIKKEYHQEFLKASGGVSEYFFDAEGKLTSVLKIMPTANVTGYVIAMNGNGAYYQGSFFELAELARETGLGVVSFNYPEGVGSADQVVKIGTKLTRKYIEEVGDAKKIILKGHSIGGAFASIIASNLHKGGVTVKLVTDRTFTSLASLVSGLVFKSLGLWLPRFAASLVLYAAGWRMEPKEAIKNIPEGYRYHFYIDEDEVIVKGTRKFEGENEEVVKKISDRVAEIHSNRHNSMQSELETEDGKVFLQAMAAKIKELLAVRRPL